MSEKLKYETIWKEYDYSSPRQMQIVQYIEPYLDGLICELGCGDGTVTQYLIDKGLAAFGVDITLEGIKKPNLYKYMEAPLWALPFSDKMFDMTFSSDVLEHLPTELVGRSLEQINKITNNITIHGICTREADRDYSGYKVHLTVRPIEWWEEQFKKHMDCKYKLIEL